MKHLVRPPLFRLFSAALVVALVNPLPAVALRPVRAGAEEIAAGLEEKSPAVDLAQYGVPPKATEPAFISAQSIGSGVEIWLSRLVMSAHLRHLLAAAALEKDRYPRAVTLYGEALEGWI